MKPLACIKAQGPGTRKGSLCCGLVVSLYHQESFNFQRLLEKFNLWILLGMKWSLTIFQTGWEQHQRVTQPAEKWETSGCLWFCPYVAFKLLFQKHKLHQVIPFLLLRSFYNCSFALKISEEPHYLLSLTLHLFFLPSLQPQSTEDATLPHSSVPHTWPSVPQPPGKSSVIPEVQLKLCPSLLLKFPLPTTSSSYTLPTK